MSIWLFKPRPAQVFTETQPAPLSIQQAAELFEHVPLPSLLIAKRHLVLSANAAARTFFNINSLRLPLTLIEATREARLAAITGDFDGSGTVSNEVRLAHQPKVVAVTLVPGPDPDLLWLHANDVTELRRLQTVRQEFVGNLSHELKTPLASLRLAAESLLGNPPADVRRRFAQRVVDEATHLANIIDNLRQLADIESGRARLNPSQFSFAELMKEVRTRHGADDRIQLHSADIRLIADRSKVAQVIDNLVDNALKFSPPATPVEVGASVAEEGGSRVVIVTVRDRGPGISPEHSNKVFERLYKIDPARSREQHGSGLGLAIAKHLVLAHGGRIWTQNCTDGGQMFSFSLPQSGAAA